MKKVLFFAIATLFLTILISCNKESNPICGANNEFDMYLLGSSIVDSSTGFYYSYRDGNNRVFQWSELVKDVCSDEHVKVELSRTYISSMLLLFFEWEKPNDHLYGLSFLFHPLKTELYFL